MPSPRRRPAPQPSRRPQVAGLRRPGSKPSPRPRPTPESPQQEDLSADEGFTDGTHAPAESWDVIADAPVTEPEAPAEAEQPEADVDDQDTALVEEPEEAQPASKPTPRRKAHDGGVPRPTSAGEIEVARPIEETHGAPAGGGGSRNNTPFWIAVALAVLFAVGAGLLGWQYFSAAGTTENKAQSDPISSSQAKEEIAAAVQTLFSYDYGKLDGRDDEVNELLASDKLHKQFKTLNCAVNEEAPKQKIVTATRVSYSAITELTGDTAKAIVFVENVWQRKSTKQQDAGAGSLGVSAALVDGKWKLTDIKIHGGQAGKEPTVPAKCK